MDLADLVERAEIAAWTDMIAACPAPLAGGLGLHTVALGGGLAISAPRVDAPEFNRTMGLGLRQPVSESDLDTVVALYRPHKLTYARLQLAPHARPATLGKMLADRNLARAPLDWVKMARPTADPPTVLTDLAVTLADASEAGHFGATACAGFGMPPMLAPWLSALVGRPDWRCYLAYDGDRPVSAAALFLGEDFGWLGVAATLPEGRRRGGQGALMARRIADALAAGKSWAVTETGAPVPGQTSPSHDNMIRCGFDLVHRRANYIV